METNVIQTNLDRFRASLAQRPMSRARALQIHTVSLGSIQDAIKVVAEDAGAQDEIATTSFFGSAAAAAIQDAVQNERRDPRLDALQDRANSLAFTLIDPSLADPVPEAVAQDVASLALDVASALNAASLAASDEVQATLVAKLKDFSDKIVFPTLTSLKWVLFAGLGLAALIVGVALYNKVRG